MSTSQLHLRILLGSLAILTFHSILLSQDNGRWLRVLTSEDSITEVDRLSLVIEKDQVIGARFRTIVTTPESVSVKTSDTYRSREDMIRFDLNNYRYRFSDTVFFDSAGKRISRGNPRDLSEWKPLYGGIGDRLLSAATQLRPFGIWAILSARFATGEALSRDDPPELQKLVGSAVNLGVREVSVGGQTCSKPVFEMKGVTNDESLKRIGVPLSALSINADRADALLFACTIAEKQRTYTMVILLPGDKALMSWDGVFLELHRSKNIFLP